MQNLHRLFLLLTIANMAIRLVEAVLCCTLALVALTARPRMRGELIRRRSKINHYILVTNGLLIDIICLV
jgi:hypothetical protein